MSHHYLEIETKYDATDIRLMDFKILAEKMSPLRFYYVESKDIYYTRGGNEFLRYRMAPSKDDLRSELTLKKKHSDKNNNVRTEINLRVDPNESHTVIKFCEELGYARNFSIVKYCHIYYFEDANIVYYSVLSEDGKVAHFIEIECDEHLTKTQEQGWEIIQKYEKALAPLGITAQKRKKLSLFEMYQK